MIICLLIPLSTVNASDINNTADNQVLSATPSVDTLSASVNPENNNDTLSVQNDENLLSAGTDSGSNNLLGDDGTASYKDLDLLIKSTESGETLNLTQDYTYSSNDGNNYLNGIPINKPITIDGQGKYGINGNDLAQALTINADNVTLKNMKILNLKIQSNENQGILWLGANGKVENSLFNKSTSAYANSVASFIAWRGINGTITQSTFTQSYFSLKSQGDYDKSTILVLNNNLEISESIFTYNTGSCVVECTAASENTMIYKCNFINNTNTYDFGNIIFFRRGNGVVDTCNFIENSVRYEGIISSRVHSLVKNSNFTKNKLPISNSVGITSYCSLDNCTFKDNTANQMVLLRSNEYINNCTIYHGNYDGVRVSNGVNILINDTRFYDATRRSIILNGAGVSQVNISNSIFKNINTTEQYTEYIPIIEIYNCNLTSIENCVFEDITLGSDYYALHYREGYGGLVNIKDNTFNNVLNATGSDLWDCNVPSNVTFTLNLETTVTNVDDLKKALTTVVAGGTIYVKNGEYDLENLEYTTAASLIGESQSGVKIINPNLKFSSENSKIMNITLYNVTKQTSVPLNFTVTNVLFTEMSADSSIFSCFDNSFARYFKMYNVSISDSKFTYLVSTNGNSEVFNINNLNITRSNFTSLLYGATHVSNTLKNVNIISCNIASVINENINVYLGNYYQNSLYENFRVINCNVSYAVYVGKDNSLANNDKLKDWYIYNNNLTHNSNGLLHVRYNTELENINIENTTVSPTLVSIDGIIDVIRNGNVLSNVNIKNVTKQNIVSIRGSDNTIDVSLDDVRGDVGLSIIGDSIFSDLSITNSNFNNASVIVDNVTTFNKGELNNNNGSFVVNARNTHINNVIFKNMNSSFDDYGVVIVNATHVMFNGCTFENNNGSYGAAIYIDKFNDTSIRNTIFIKDTNIATVAGGAIYTNYAVYFEVDDYSMTNITQVQGTIDEDKHNTLFAPKRMPTFYVIYVYHDAKGTVDENNSYHTSDIRTAFALINPTGKIIANGSGENFTFADSGNEFTKDHVEITGSNNRIYVNHTLTISEDATYLSFQKD